MRGAVEHLACSSGSQPVVGLLGEGRYQLPDPTRSARESLIADALEVANSPVVKGILDALDSAVLVLNARREVLAANRAALAMRGTIDLLGLRPGEAIACGNAAGPGGCGTTRHCETCGALGAILACHAENRPVEAECQVRREAGPGAAQALSVRASPLRVGGRTLTVLALRDVTGQKRLDALEQAFLHDALNTVAGLLGWAQVLQHREPGGDGIGARIEALTRQLEREIHGHRDLLAAERGSLTPTWKAVSAAGLLREAGLVFSSHPAAAGRTLEAEAAPAVDLVTDATLALRVLVNMICNALEATPQGGRVRLWAELDGGRGVRFRVHNQGCMPPEVQERIFRRSFSTKRERGRGLGTYGMRLLGERYLAARVSFESTEAGGTTFTLELPLAPPPAKASSPGGLGSGVAAERLP